MTDYNANIPSTFVISLSSFKEANVDVVVIPNVQQANHHDATIMTIPVTTQSSYDFKLPPKNVFYYDMRGLDIDCGSPTYRFWTTKEAPDLTGAYYTDTKCGISPLTDIVVVRKYVKVG